MNLWLVRVFFSQHGLDLFGNYIFNLEITCLEPVCPLFWGFNPPKEGRNSNQNKGHQRVPGENTQSTPTAV